MADDTAFGACVVIEFKSRTIRARWVLIAITISALAVLWVRSYWRADAVAFFTPSGKAQAFASFNGRAALVISTVSFGPERGLSIRWEADRPDWAEALASEYFDVCTTRHDAGRFAFLGGPVLGPAMLTANPGPDPTVWYAVQCPYWFLTAVVVLPSILPAFKAFRNAQRQAKGLCIHCGYDLRESPQRCPECGVAPRT